MTKKIKDLRSKVDVHLSTHERALRVLDECKKDLAEIFELIEKLKTVDPEQLSKAVLNLNPKEKAILLNFIKQGEICLKLQEIHKKEPKYIN